MAFNLLERALACGSMTAMAFVLSEHLGRRSPPRTLAQHVQSAADRADAAAPAATRAGGKAGQGEAAGGGAAASEKKRPGRAPTPAQARKSRLARQLVAELAGNPTAVARSREETADRPNRAAAPRPKAPPPPPPGATPPAASSESLRKLKEKLKEGAAVSFGWPLGP